MPFHRVLDITTTLVVEIYRELGMKFDEAYEDVMGRLHDSSDPKSRPAPKPAPPDDASSMAMLSAMIGNSDFKGARG